MNRSVNRCAGGVLGRSASAWAAALVVIATATWSGTARAQDAAEMHGAAVSDELAASKALRSDNVGLIAQPLEKAVKPAIWRDLFPEVNAGTLTWIAIVVILVLLLQTKPILSWHNLDALMLALTALLFPLRGNTGVLSGAPGGYSVQWWTYLLLCVVAVYWVVRGAALLLMRQAPARTTNVSEGAMFVLIVAGLCMAGFQIAEAPVTDGGRDGLIGGVCFAETGKLPYGDAPGHDARSPLLYVLHAGAIQAVEPMCEPDGKLIEMRWENRASWLNEKGLDTIDPAPIRLVNAALFILLFAAVAGIGHRLHSMGMGQTLAALLCIFPGAYECFTQPDVMLPAVLLAWSVLFATAPVIGGFLSVVTVIFAGLAWPWAWLAAPVLIAYMLRQGWQAFGAVIGFTGAVAALIAGIAAWVQPTPPREHGCLAEAGITPSYAARTAGDGAVVIDRYAPESPAATDFKKWIWKPLLAYEKLTLDSAEIQLAYPNGVDGASINYCDVTSEGKARTALQGQYRRAMQERPRNAQIAVAVRSLLESCWKPAQVSAESQAGTWSKWHTASPSVKWTTVRRAGKIGLGVLTLFAAFMLIRGERGRLHQLLGGILIVCAGALLISMNGVATNWAWLTPVILACFAASSRPDAGRIGAPSLEALPSIEDPAPRITVEK